MISRSGSAPTAAAISIEWTTSAKRTVTCLYSADRVASVRRAPHSPQNLAVGLDGAPQEPQVSPSRPANLHHPRWGPLQHRFTLGQRCPPYHPAISDTRYW